MITTICWMAGVAVAVGVGVAIGVDVGVGDPRNAIMTAFMATEEPF
jgi:hypothetical protein